MDKLNIIVGPKLKVDYDHSTEEKDFLATKNDYQSNELLDFGCENKKLNEKIKENASFKKTTNQDVKLFTSENISRKHELYLVNFNNPNISDSEKNRRKKTSGKSKESIKTINLLNVFKRAKVWAMKIRKTLYFKNYKNMTNVQKKILNDVSVFPDDQNKFQSKVRLKLK